MDHPVKEEFNELLKGYLRESLNPQELTRFFELAAEAGNAETLAQSFQRDLEVGVPDLSRTEERREGWRVLSTKMETRSRSVLPMSRVLRWVAILVCLLGAAVAAYQFNFRKKISDTANVKPEIKIPAWLKAEHIGATLYLGSGDSIILNSESKGVIAKDDGVQVLQSGGAISYSGKSGGEVFNEIKTGRGKLWRVILPDQTIVWLNGGSSIRYPLSFGADSRSVELTGEAYFEVVHHAGYPFRVKTGGYIVEDIGTVFNIKSFNGDHASTATLIEGSVNVKLNGREATLKVGEQSLVSPDKNEIRVVQHANMAEVMAWKNGFFYFQNADLTDVMKQISDWYGVTVVYKGSGPKQLFSGQIDKSLSLSEVLLGLQQPGVVFRLDGNQISVIQQ
ncbi:MAG TPA: FecR domain-containing protein [Puia sp.]|nr:FecR domain-containing protein [Puia sp.]